MSPEQLSCLAEMVREEMREDWRRGRRTPLEAYLSRHRELAGLANSASDRLIDLIYAEYRLASTHGRSPDLTDYTRRFPQLKDRLERLFAIHATLNSESDFPAAPSLPGQLAREPIVAALSDAPQKGPRYRPLQLHAKGGLGEVFVARDSELPRDVALKEIQPRFEAGQRDAGRLRRDVGRRLGFGEGAGRSGRPRRAAGRLAGNASARCVGKLVGRLTEAERLLRDNHQRQARLLGLDHPQTLIASGILAGVLLELGDVEESLPLFDRFLAKRRAQVVAGGELRFSQTLYNVARDLLLAGQADRAEALLRECLALREKHSPSDWSTFQAQSLLGAAIGARETNDSEAAIQLLAGYDGLQSFAGRLPADRERELPLAAWRLMKHHLSRGDAEQAANWREMLEALERARPEPPSTEREF